MPPESAAPILQKSSSIHDSIDKKKFVGVEQETAQILESVLPRVLYVGIRLFRLASRPNVSRAAVRT